MYTTYVDLIAAYLENLRGRTSYTRSFYVARQWIMKQTVTPTRTDILARHRAKGHGDFMPGCWQANKELAIQRAAFRWGLYHEVWDGGDPTVGIKRWKTKKRKWIAKFLEIRSLLTMFEDAKKDMEVRNRALIGLELLTGCRQGEAPTALMGAITPYGDAGCWNKGKTKNGEDHEIPVPRQAMAWLNAWLAIRAGDARYNGSPYMFLGADPCNPLTDHGLRHWWRDMCDELGITGLWNYDLRRTLATYLSNELNYPDKKIQAILNHYDGRAFSHYCHVSFDALVPVVQHYADWLFSLNGKPSESEASTPAPVVRRVLAPEASWPMVQLPDLPQTRGLDALDQQAERILGTLAPPPILAIAVEQVEQAQEWPG